MQLACSNVQAYHSSLPFAAGQVYVSIFFHAVYVSIFFHAVYVSIFFHAVYVIFKYHVSSHAMQLLFIVAYLLLKLSLA